MNKIITIAVCLMAWVTVTSYAQESRESDSEVAAREWLGNLYDIGVYVNADSMLITPEVQEILGNESLQKLLYPEEYSWKVALMLLDRMELKKAFWYFINLYPDHKDLVMKSVLHYDKILEMDHVLVGVFYTYALVDPEVCTLEDGHPNITRPDLIEAKLRTVKEMVQHVVAYRAFSQKQAGQQKGG